MDLLSILIVELNKIIDELEGLEEIISRLNEIYGIGITEENKVIFENIIPNILGNEGLSTFLMNVIAEKIYREMKE